MNSVLIFPNQLYKNHPLIEKDKKIFVIEDSLFFGDKQYPLKFHKQKLVLHRASILSYVQNIRKKYDITHIKYVKNNNLFNVLQNIVKKHKIEKFETLEPVDFILKKRLLNAADKLGIEIELFENPGFLNTQKEIEEYFGDRKSFFFTKFYIQQRRKLSILLEEDGKPVGGKWSFDPENRKKLPKKIEIPEIGKAKQNKFVKQAILEIESEFPDNYGITDNFIYPIDHEAAEKWLDKFLKERFKQFGDYEDAIHTEEIHVFHSVLTPMLNIGLLTPSQIVEKALNYASKHDIPLNSLEGFIRQIIGWREFMRGIYWKMGVEQRNANHFNHKNKLSKKWYTGETGIEPIDHTIKVLNEHAYTHHIERLMILGNFMLLCEIDPNEVYNWFMEMYIDSYDWVMVPNVYGMSQYSDGGKIVTKPYISSSNYVLKMSNFKKGNWCKIWDALYWRFINKHKEEFSKNMRMKFMVSLLGKKDKNDLKEMIKIGDEFIESLNLN